MPAIPMSEWLRLSAGDGSKGARLYDWAIVPLAPPTAAGFEQALLIRRLLAAPDDPKQLAYCLTFSTGGHSWRH
ncbi:MAG TPA: hypothetical protein VGP82_02650 [Ktedonobacterales bacterium]|jgi:hypothetical protein|nr:hypothetical protein [Ktedonobacterales bacterium]